MRALIPVGVVQRLLSCCFLLIVSALLGACGGSLAESGTITDDASTGDSESPSDGAASDADSGESVLDRVAVSVTPDVVVLAAGDTMTVNVAVQSTVPTTVEVDVLGLPQGVTVAPINIAAGQAGGSITFVSTKIASQGVVQATVRARGASASAEGTAAITLDVRGRPGAVDTTFGGGGRKLGFGRGGDTAFTTEILPDGKLLVGGSYWTGSRSYPVLARYLPDGALDPTFGDGGIVVTDELGVAHGGNGDRVVAMATQPDGAILVLLATNEVVRYSAAGQLDVAFGAGGVAKVDFGTFRSTLVGMAVQPDGKVVAVGTAYPTDLSSYCFGVLRLTTSGAYDTTFGTAGRVLTTFPGNAWVASVALDLAGATTKGIVVVGTSTGADSLAVARYSATDGALDPSFDGDGKRLIKLTAGRTVGWDVSVKDGKLIILAFAHDFIRTTHLVRLLADGSSDTAFGTDGAVFAAVEEIRSFSVDAAGAIFISGTTRVTTRDVVVMRFSSSGTLDRDFGGNGDGRMILPNWGSVRRLATQSDGKVVLSGSRGVNGDPDIALGRLRADGAVDATFGAGGSVLTNVGPGDDFLTSAVILEDGRVLAAGATFNGSTFGLLVLRLSANGDLDSTFGTNGAMRMSFDRSDSAVAYGIALQADGKIIVGGSRELSHIAVRLSAEGAVDTSFGVQGVARTDGGPGLSLALQSDGKILVPGGSFDQNVGIARFTPSGARDVFGVGGLVETSFGGRERAHASVLLPDQRLLVVGDRSIAHSPPDTPRDWIAARYLPDGTLDPSFNGDGKLQIDLGGDETAQTVALQGDGKFLIGGTRTRSTGTDAVLARYAVDGTVDGTFGVDGRSSMSVGAGGALRSAIVEPNGSIVGAGCSGDTADAPALFVARWTPAGILDAAFGAGGTSAIAMGARSSCARAVLRGGTKLFVVGSARDARDEDVFVSRHWD